jgi:hypothetical protein
MTTSADDRQTAHLTGERLIAIAADIPQLVLASIQGNLRTLNEKKIKAGEHALPPLSYQEINALKSGAEAALSFFLDALARAAEEQI